MTLPVTTALPESGSDAETQTPEQRRQLAEDRLARAARRYSACRTVQTRRVFQLAFAACGRAGISPEETSAIVDRVLPRRGV